MLFAEETTVARDYETGSAGFTYVGPKPWPKRWTKKEKKKFLVGSFFSQLFLFEKSPAALLILIETWKTSVEISFRIKKKVTFYMHWIKLKFSHQFYN